MSTKLGELCRATKPSATIFLMGCLAGSGGPGNTLLRILSRMMNPRTIVGFTRVASNGPQRRPGGQCDEPGTRDTSGWGSSNEKEETQSTSDWRDLNKLPWADQNSPHAKVAQGGSITRWPAGEDDDGGNPPPPTVQELFDKANAI